MSTYPLRNSLGQSIQTLFLSNLNCGDTQQTARYQALEAFCQNLDAADGSPCAGNWQAILANAFLPGGTPVAFQNTGTDTWSAPAYTWQVLRYMSHWLVVPDLASHGFKASNHAVDFMKAITTGATPTPNYNSMVSQMVSDINGAFPAQPPGDLVLSMSP